MSKASFQFWTLEHLLRLWQMVRVFVNLPGGARGLRFALRFVPKPDTPIEIKDFDSDLKLCLQLNEHMQCRSLWQGQCFVDLARHISSCLRPGMAVIGARANIGPVTLLAIDLRYY